VAKNYVMCVSRIYWMASKVNSCFWTRAEQRENELQIDRDMT